MNLEKLQEKFYYVQVKDKYDVIKAHDLLKEIGVKVFGSDEDKLKFINKKNDINNSFLIKNGDGWRIQSHFIATDNTIEELEKEVNIYTRKQNRENLTDEQKDKCEKAVTKFSADIDSFGCYLYHNFDNLKDIKEVKEEFNYFVKRISKRYEQGYDDFKKDADFKSKLNSYLREIKLNNVLD